MNGVNPVERSSPAGTPRIGPGSEKRTLFWLLGFRLGVFTERHDDGSSEGLLSEVLVLFRSPELTRRVRRMAMGRSRSWAIFGECLVLCPQGTVTRKAATRIRNLQTELLFVLITVIVRSLKNKRVGLDPLFCLFIYFYMGSAGHWYDTVAVFVSTCNLTAIGREALEIMRVPAEGPLK